MRAYFLTLNGMGSRLIYDGDFFCFWPIQDLIMLARAFPDRCGTIPDPNCYFLFADHSVGAPYYAIRLFPDVARPTPVVGVRADDGALDVQDCFPSFSAFLTAYLNDPFDVSVCYVR